MTRRVVCCDGIASGAGRSNAAHNAAGSMVTASTSLLNGANGDAAAEAEVGKAAPGVDAVVDAAVGERCADEDGDTGDRDDDGGGSIMEAVFTSVMVVVAVGGAVANGAAAFAVGLLVDM